jgi:hypothetical protein
MVIVETAGNMPLFTAVTVPISVIPAPVPI